MSDMDRREDNFIGRLELSLAKYQNVINVFGGIIGFVLAMLSFFISVNSLEESKKAYDLTTKGSNLEVTMATQKLKKYKDGWVEPVYSEIENKGIILRNKNYEGSSFYIGDVNFVSTNLGILNIFIKNTGYAPARDISLKVDYENIIVVPKTDKPDNINSVNDFNKYMRENKYENIINSQGWNFRYTDFYGRGKMSEYGIKPEIDYSEVLDIAYSAQHWNSNKDNVVIFPGETHQIKLNMGGNETLYLLGDEGKIKLSITSSNSTYYEYEFTIKR